MLFKEQSIHVSLTAFECRATFH